jgi:hypothetical protein
VIWGCRRPLAFKYNLRNIVTAASDYFSPADYEANIRHATVAVAA